MVKAGLNSRFPILVRFNNVGLRYGMGAEIGNSPQQLPARGPIGLRELTTFKYVVRGDGQVRG